MLNFYSLYSGSSGNCLFLQSKDTKILIDAGVSCKKIEIALTNINIDPSTIDGILITHEHIDHVQGLGTLSKKFNIPIYINEHTLNAMPKQKEKINMNNVNFIHDNEKFIINDLKIKPFSIPHDAINPYGFNIWKGDKKISIATDLGHMNNDILKHLEESLFVMLESNYDPEILKCSSYPFNLKTRIAGPTGHLPNEIAGKTLSHLLKSGLKTAMIGHLSKESNFPELAYTTVMNEIISNNTNNDFSLDLCVATRDSHSKLITI